MYYVSSMATYNSILGIVWFCFLLYWFISSFSAKKSLQNGVLWGSVLIRIGLIAVVFLALHFGLVKGSVLHQLIPHFYTSRDAYQILAILGDFISVLGLALALWARTILGRNWGMPMMLRADPELVTTGPYAYIRHTIYTALFLMILGSALVEGSFWIIVLLIVFIYFYISARKEEVDMAMQFPDQYPAYKKRTKMMVPFLF
jgi:protein-S-isoprenylcysteine O-methyltransferase Ste14